MGSLWRFKALEIGGEAPSNSGSVKFWRHCPGVLAGGSYFPARICERWYIVLLSSRLVLRTF